MTSIKDKASACCLGLIIGLLNRNDIGRWADKAIETQQKVDYRLIDLSLYASKFSIADLELKLSEFPGNANHKQVIDLLLGQCAYKYNSNDISAKETSSILYQLLLVDSIVYNSDLGHTLRSLTDGYDLACDGIGSVEESCRELKEFLDPYMIYADEFHL